MRAVTERQPHCDHCPSSSATNVLGLGSPFDTRQLGSTGDEPSVHHNISGSYTVDSRWDSSCANVGAMSAVNPIGICQGCEPSLSTAAAAGSSTTLGGRIDSSDSPSMMTWASNASKSI